MAIRPQEAAAYSLSPTSMPVMFAVGSSLMSARVATGASSVVLIHGSAGQRRAGGSHAVRLHHRNRPVDERLACCGQLFEVRDVQLR